MDLRVPAELLPPIAQCAVRGLKPGESDGCGSIPCSPRCGSDG